MTRVKICGITNEKDALLAASLGAWALGFIFYKKSPRYVTPDQAKKIIFHLPPFIVPVGVFVNEKGNIVDDIAELCGINTFQFHGNEPPDYCHRFSRFRIIKAFRVNEDFDFNQISKYRVSAYLFDTFQEGVYGGSGKTFNWEILKNKKIERPFILSGGLNPENVGEAALLSPYAVDVSSGVEASPGKKDPSLLKDFFNKII